jgi:hypothetical protein
MQVRATGRIGTFLFGSVTQKILKDESMPIFLCRALP